MLAKLLSRRSAHAHDLLIGRLAHKPCQCATPWQQSCLTSTYRACSSVSNALDTSGSQCTKSITCQYRTRKHPAITIPTILSNEKRCEFATVAPRPPVSRFIGALPQTWRPYAELIRIDKPAGTFYLYWPCLFSTLFAASLRDPVAPLSEVLWVSTLFLAGAFVMRGAGCTFNDLCDRELDPHVTRTRFRPIARGAILPGRALGFFGIQLAMGAAILLQFPTACLWYGIPSLSLLMIYPFMKRVTNYPQAVLGIAFSWGAILGFPAMDVEITSNLATLASAASLYGSCVIWTIIYDMIYAHMDLCDDAQAGIKSIAQAHRHRPKELLTRLVFAHVALLAIAGIAADAGPLYYVGSCGTSLATLLTMVCKVRLDDPVHCWWWFRSCCFLIGGGISLGLAANYGVRLRGESIRANRHPEGNAAVAAR